jgi:hypothetical protein
MFSRLDEFIFIPVSDFILASVGERPRLMDENFNPPAGSYCAVKIEQIAPIAWGNSAYDADTDQVYHNYTTFEATVRILAIGKDSLTKAQVIACSLRDKNLLRNTLRPKGLAYFNSTSVRDTSTSWLDKRERRYEFLCQFRFIQGGPEKGDAPFTIETFGGATGSYTTQ